MWITTDLELNLLPYIFALTYALFSWGKKRTNLEHSEFTFCNLSTINVNLSISTAGMSTKFSRKI